MPPPGANFIGLLAARVGRSTPRCSANGRSAHGRHRAPECPPYRARVEWEGQPATSIALTVACGPVHRRQAAWRDLRPPDPWRLRAGHLAVLGVSPRRWVPAAREPPPPRCGTRNRLLARAGLPDGSPVTLLDPNVNVLGHASRRLQNLDVTTIEADVLKPLPVDGPFDSAALNGVLHCLSGPLTSKAAAVANVAAVLAPEGVLFGSSILGTSGRHTWLGRRILEANNRRGTFQARGLSTYTGAWARPTGFEHGDATIFVRVPIEPRPW